MNENILDFELELNNLKDKKILFIATKNADYIRITQEIRLLMSLSSKVEVITYKDKNYFKRLIKIYKKLINFHINDYDIVFVGFMAQLIIPIFIKKFLGKVVYVDFFISLYDTLVFDRKIIQKGSLLSELCRWLDKKTLNNADIVLCDTRAHGKYFMTEFVQHENKFRVLYLEADKSIYYPKKVEKPEKWKNKFIVLYFGSILPLQGVDIVLQSIELLKEEKSIQFVIVGPINKNYKKFENDTVTYINWLEQEKLAEYIAFSDVCLAGHFSKDIEKAKRTIPGKAYIYNMMKKKMILGDCEANREIYDDIDDRVSFVSMGDSEKLSKMICYLKNDCKDVRS